MTMLTMNARLRIKPPVPDAPEAPDASAVSADARHLAAFVSLWEAERARVWRLTARLSGSPDHADDLTQEVALRALAAWPDFRGRARASTWLHRIAVNVTLRWRESIREQTAPDWEALAERLPAREQTPEMIAVQSDECARTRAALDQLPETLRAPLVLHVWEGLKYREIAELLEIPSGTVMSRLHAARKLLRDALGEGHADAL